MKTPVSQMQTTKSAIDFEYNITIASLQICGALKNLIR